jgi:chemotaxis methyl-accepting protein methylase
MTAVSVSPVASAADLQSIGAYVESRSAILCPPDKHYLFEARLRPIIRSQGLSGMSELAHKLRLGGSTALGDAVVEAMTETASIQARLSPTPEPETLKMSKRPIRPP